MTSPDTPEQPPVSTMSRGQRNVLIGVATAVGLVILAPITLSMQHLVAWAADPHGLNLGGWWPYLVPIALDLAAAACIGMTVVSAWRRERPGAFGILVWVFAGVSAWAQYRYGVTERNTGGAQDAWWAMPLFATLGTLILELVLHKTRQWARKDSGELLSGAAGFGVRWLPGVGFRETLQAWAASRREGIPRAADAITFVRERKALKALSPVEALHYAFGALGVVHPHQARTWLLARGKTVTQSDIDKAVDGLPVAPEPVSGVPALTSGAPYGDTREDRHSDELMALPTKRRRMQYAASALAMQGAKITGPGIVAWLSDRGHLVDRKEAAEIAKQLTAGA